MRTIVVVGLIAAAAAAATAEQNPLERAKDLYASAAYEEALSTLSHRRRVGTPRPAPVDEYRAFCLLRWAARAKRNRSRNRSFGVSRWRLTPRTRRCD
jgi:hypothetical protein